MKVMEVNQYYKDLFDGIGLSDFEAFMSSDVGHILSLESLRETRKFSIKGFTFFLKRIKKFKYSSALEAFLQGRWPHSYAWREMQHVYQLKQAGIPVMSIAAVGENRHWGLPKESFIVVVGVEGTELNKAFESSDEAGKSIIMNQLGVLYAQLHRHGFLKPIRLKDLIRTQSQELILIDRETRNPFPRSFSQRRAIKSLTKAKQRQVRDGIHYSKTDNTIMLRAYYRNCSELWSESEQLFIEKTLKKLS